MTEQSSFIPNRIWAYVPEAIDRWDVGTTVKIQSLVNSQGEFWQAFRWLSESPLGISFFYFGCYAFWAASGSLNAKRISNGLFRLLILIMFLGGSDLVANYLLKVPFGRLKQSVPHFIEAAKQPLSFPSSHAVNTSCAFFLIFLFLNTLERRQLKLPLMLSFFITLFVLFSRIVLREHYFLDVASGFLLGGLLALSLRTPFSYFWNKAQLEAKL